MTTPDSAARPYHLPPDDYAPPTKCVACSGLVYFSGRIGGERWHHLDDSDATHDVVLNVDPWFDVVTGRWVEGNPWLEVGRAAMTDSERDGLTGGLRSTAAAEGRSLGGSTAAIPLGEGPGLKP